MKRNSLGVRWLSAVAMLCISVPVLAQPPEGAEPAPVTGPASPTTAADPATAASPATAVSQPQDDDWSKLMRQGQQQERASETDEERERREHLAERDRPLDPAILSLRQRLRFFVWAAGGVRMLNLPERTKVNPYHQHVSGWTLGLGLGVRGSVANHFELHARGGAFWESYGSQETSVNLPPGGLASSPRYYSSSSDTSGFSFNLGATVRWLPGTFGPRFFVGLGPQLQLTLITVSVAPSSNGSTSFPPLDENLSIVAAHGLLELGAIFGASEEWEASIQGAVGVASPGKDSGAVIATLARAF